MQEQLRQLLSSKGVNLDDVSYGFHWPPFTSIDHLHMHAIAPVSKMRIISKIIFKPINLWYCTVYMTKNTLTFLSFIGIIIRKIFFHSIYSQNMCCRS